MYYVYILRSVNTKKLYIGFSEMPYDRLNTHNKGGNQSTKPFRPWIIIYLEGYLSKRDGLAREKFLKGGSGRKYLYKQLRFYLTEN